MESRDFSSAVPFRLSKSSAGLNPIAPSKYSNSVGIHSDRKAPETIQSHLLLFDNEYRSRHRESTRNIQPVPQALRSESSSRGISHGFHDAYANDTNLCGQGRVAAIESYCAMQLHWML